MARPVESRVPKVFWEMSGGQQVARKEEPSRSLDVKANVNRDWNTGHNGFMYALWGFWWLDAALAYTIAFGVIFFILGQKSRDIAKVVPIWIIPVVALIASSTCGGLLGNALISHSHTMALVSSAFALTMCIIGLSFTTMITSSFLLRLFIHGVPEATTVLATFNTLTPLGQGGYSLLVNGENLSKLIPIQLGDDFPQSQLSGQMFYSICFCFAYILWCMGIAWSLVSIFSIGRRATKLPKFCVTHWCIVFPNGVFALLSVQIGNVLDSRFYKGFGAAWSIIVFILWTGLFIRSIPAFIDGTIFLSPVPRAPHKSRKKKSVRNEKHELPHEHDHDDGSTLCDDAATIRHPSPDTPPTPTRSLTVPKSSVPLANPMQLVSKPSVSQPEPSAPNTLERPMAAELPATEHVTVHNTWSAKVFSGCGTVTASDDEALMDYRAETISHVEGQVSGARPAQ
ncbi:hypothetical protein PHLCEN_2v139 [Hermanssonia centrifuga]|uniref:Uncharacterized protein n=1 Tax=Hermanssonia centrifuga TaxID=98765 RepID=A0A2R6S6Y3_9APHY|nr:hypothetical protein PHLCEN_2v139 [Hermanssonia centrifuga]